MTAEMLGRSVPRPQQLTVCIKMKAFLKGAQTSFKTHDRGSCHRGVKTGRLSGWEHRRGLQGNAQQRQQPGSLVKALHCGMALCGRRSMIDALNRVLPKGFRHVLLQDVQYLRQTGAPV